MTSQFFSIYGSNTGGHAIITALSKISLLMPDFGTKVMWLYDNFFTEATRQDWTRHYKKREGTKWMHECFHTYFNQKKTYLRNIYKNCALFIQMENSGFITSRVHAKMIYPILIQVKASETVYFFKT